jgi:large subunit ribosomal protein L15
MKLNELKPAIGSKKSRRRVGRGLGSGRGKTAGRGQKGQSSRSGFSQGAGWEGGRSRLIMRLPKRGFTREKELFQLVNLEDLNVFEAGATVDAETLKQRGLIRHSDRPVKLLGRGELEVSKLTVEVDKVSRSAAQAVQDKGGSVGAAPAEIEADSTGGSGEEQA